MIISILENTYSSDKKRTTKIFFLDQEYYLKLKAKEKVKQI